MRTKIIAMMLLMSGVTCCDAFGNGLLSRMLGRGGCCGASSCCDTGSSCGAGLHISLDVHMHLPRLRRGGCGTACDTGCDTGAVVNGCGCNAPVAAAPCGGCDAGCDAGCGSCAGGLLSGFSGFGLRNRWNNGCGCDAPVVAAGCGCDNACDNVCDPCAGRPGFLSNLRGRLGGFGGCGCDNGCGATVAGCGCDNGCDAGRVVRCREPRQICIRVPNLGLLDRVRGMGAGCGCDTGCDACGGTIVGNGCGCNAAPAQAQPEAVPADAQGSINRGTTPTVDPNAFIIRGANYRNN